MRNTFTTEGSYHRFAGSTQSIQHNTIGIPVFTTEL